MDTNFESDISAAYKEVDAVLDKYGLEWCGHVATEMWLEPKTVQLRSVPDCGKDNAANLSVVNDSHSGDVGNSVLDD